MVLNFVCHNNNGTEGVFVDGFYFERNVSEFCRDFEDIFEFDSKWSNKTILDFYKDALYNNWGAADTIETLMERHLIEEYQLGNIILFGDGDCEHCGGMIENGICKNCGRNETY